MRSRGAKRSSWFVVLGLIPVLLSVLLPGIGNAHGFTNGPVSRAYHCYRGTVKNCGAIQWEPQSVEGPKGFPTRGPADGRICAGGLSMFAELDAPRAGAWPTSPLTSGASTAIRWSIPVPHSTTTFRYFITKDGFDPTQKLTRASLEPQPFLSVSLNGRQPSPSTSHTATILAGKSGRHLLLAVWDIADTGNAFYQCVDVTL